MGRPPKRPNEKGEWKCSHCKHYKPDEEFYHSKQTSNGLQPRCKKCMNDYQFQRELINSRIDLFKDFSQRYPGAPLEKIESLIDIHQRQVLCEKDGDWAEFNRLVPITNTIHKQYQAEYGVVTTAEKEATLYSRSQDPTTGFQLMGPPTSSPPFGGDSDDEDWVNAGYGTK